MVTMSSVKSACSPRDICVGSYNNYSESVGQLRHHREWRDDTRLHGLVLQKQLIARDQQQIRPGGEQIP